MIRAARLQAEAVAARAQAETSSTQALIAHLKLQIEKLRRELYGTRSERNRWERFASFLDDGRICLSNNAAERALRGFALGRKSWLFAGSERGADRAAAVTTLIVTAKLNDVDPQAWLADVLARIASTPQSRRHELLPWEWKASSKLDEAA